MMRFGTVYTTVDGHTETHLSIGTDLTAETLDEAILQASHLPFPEGANLVKVIDRDSGGVIHKVLKPLND